MRLRTQNSGMLNACGSARSTIFGFNVLHDTAPAAKHLLAQEWRDAKQLILI